MLVVGTHIRASEELNCCFATQVEVSTDNVQLLAVKCWVTVVAVALPRINTELCNGIFEIIWLAGGP